MKLSEIQFDDASLLVMFNRREISSFCEVYRRHFNRLYYFANRTFFNTSIDAEDIIQDIFTSVWENKSIQFHSIDHIVGYLYLSIRNKYKDYSIRKERVNRYTNSVVQDDDNSQTYMLESETLSIISEAINLLPNECGKVFRMHIDGWEIKDIAVELNKSQSTIYNQRKEAIKILKKKLSDTGKAILIQILSFT